MRGPGHVPLKPSASSGSFERIDPVLDRVDGELEHLRVAVHPVAPRAGCPSASVVASPSRKRLTTAAAFASWSATGVALGGAGRGSGAWDAMGIARRSRTALGQPIRCAAGAADGPYDQAGAATAGCARCEADRREPAAGQRADAQEPATAQLRSVGNGSGGRRREGRVVHGADHRAGGAVRRK